MCLLTWLIGIIDKRSPNRFPNIYVHSVLHFYHKLHVFIGDVALLRKLWTCYFNLNKLFKFGPSVVTMSAPSSLRLL